MIADFLIADFFHHTCVCACEQVVLHHRCALAAAPLKCNCMLCFNAACKDDRKHDACDKSDGFGFRDAHILSTSKLTEYVGCAVTHIGSVLEALPASSP